MIKNKETTHTKKIVTKDKKERFKEIVADNNKFSSFIVNFAKSNIYNKINNKQIASKVNNNGLKIMIKLD
jgi:hypothetical protein